MYTDREEFEGWMQRIMQRFDTTEKLLERVLKKNSQLDGEEVLDNQDLCLLLKVGIRTLQRYRAMGLLPYFTISGKVFYRAKDVHEFIRNRFDAVTERKKPERKASG
ncbi:helix-turn-helix domain-containing protein [Bacteroides ovatus]|uniref:helix-turn-helix domain-containing protein n=1 Tax=Bacteroides ovatus TaxID=28116 RepID=UPI00216584FF|nr:helix-turn-helix domain-containing protein [Bacteroides ovatus]MCS2298406.1 helix-turn-helix domain-containing protein [Bacteroides ovatus]